MQKTGHTKKNRKNEAALAVCAGAAVAIGAAFAIRIISAKGSTGNTDIAMTEAALPTEAVSGIYTNTEAPVTLAGGTDSGTALDGTAAYSVQEGETVTNIPYGYTFCVPEGYTLTRNGNIYYIRDGSCRIQCVLTVTALTFDSAKDVYSAKGDYIMRTTAYIDGEEKNMSTFGTSSCSQKASGNYTVEYETGEAWFCNDLDDNVFKIPSYSYYTTMETTDGGSHGVILNAYSEEAGEDEAYAVMDCIMETLAAYEAGESYTKVATEEWVSPLIDGTVIYYPAGWAVETNSDGMVEFSASDPSDDYAGVIIQFMADVENNFVDDYAQFSGKYEYRIIKSWFTEDVGEKAYDYTHSVTDTDLSQTIGGKECIRFEVTDMIIPGTNAVNNAMQCDSPYVNSIRYTFRGGNTECFLNFILPDGGDCSDFVGQIVNSAIVR